MTTERVTYFGAGPSALPTSVLEEASHALLNFAGTGIGIAEISHRSKEFSAFVAHLEATVRWIDERLRMGVNVLVHCQQVRLRRLPPAACTALIAM